MSAMKTETERDCPNIIQVAKEAKAGLIDLHETVLKDRKTNLPTTRYYWNRVGHKGSLYFHCGDINKPESSWPFLLREPSKHPDQSDDVSVLGAFTAIPDPEEREAFLWFREWMLQRIFEKKVVKGKKGETLESVRTEVAQLGLVPETEGHNFCFTQKLQPGGAIAELRTRAMLIYKTYVTDPATGATVAEYEEGPDLDMQTLRASSNVITNMELGELKRSQGKWRSSLYTRQLVCVTEKTQVIQDKTFRIGGVVVKRRGVEAEVPAEAAGGGSSETSPVTVTAAGDEAAFAVTHELPPVPTPVLLPLQTSSAGPARDAERKTFGDAVAEDIARLAPATLKRQASALASIPVPLLGEEGVPVAPNAGNASSSAAPQKRARVAQ